MIPMNLDVRKRLSTFYGNSKLVLGVSYKPTPEVFKKTLKIVLLGVLVLGFLGFIIATIVNLLVGV